MKQRIILVEDNEMMINFLGTYLSRKYSVVKCVKPSEVFKSLMRDGEPDLVVSDYNLPSINGDKLLRELKHIIPDTPVIMVSGKKDIDVKIDCLKSGAADYIEKPFNPRELQTRIERIIEPISA